MAEGSLTVHPDRRMRLCAWLAGHDLDCAIVTGTESVNHLLGYWRYFGSPAAAVVTASGDVSLVVIYDEAAGATEMLPAVSVESYGARGFGLDPDPLPELLDVVTSLPAVSQATQVALAADRPLADRIAGRLAVPTIDAGPTLAAIRLVKDADEVAKVVHSYELSMTAQDAVRAACRAGVSEIELFTIGQAAAQNRAGEPIAFSGDLLAGARAAEVCAPVRVAGRTQLKEGQAIVADLVAGCRGYWGDTAETLIVGSNLEVEAVRDMLLAILKASAAELVPGSTAESVFAAMHERIVEAFPGGEFPHHGGHGLGCTPYEPPHIIPGDETPLQAGMIIALEPGVYFQGRFGVRVERSYLVGAEGGRELGHAAPSGDDENGGR
jgi:Xaa-Pro aminopeptidase